MTGVMPGRQPVDPDELVDGQPVGADVLDAVDEQLIARLAGRPREGGLALTGRRSSTSRRGSTFWGSTSAVTAPSC